MKIPKHIAQQAVADSLVEAYKGERLTQPEVAERSGLTARTVQRYMSGETEVGSGTLLLLAEAIGVGASTIIDRAQARAERRTEAMSEDAPTTDDLTTRRLQREAEQMSPAEIDRIAIAADSDNDIKHPEPEAP